MLDQPRRHDFHLIVFGVRAIGFTDPQHIFEFQQLTGVDVQIDRRASEVRMGAAAAVTGGDIQADHVRREKLRGSTLIELRVFPAIHHAAVIVNDFSPEPTEQVVVDTLLLFFRVAGLYAEQRNFRLRLCPPLQVVAHEVFFLPRFELEPQ
ncbi:hypothetical protein D3C76_988680 [compost metagenome]